MALNVTFIKATEAVSANYPLTPAGLQSVQATEADNDKIQTTTTTTEKEGTSNG